MLRHLFTNSCSSSTDACAVSAPCTVLPRYVTSSLKCMSALIVLFVELFGNRYHLGHERLPLQLFEAVGVLKGDVHVDGASTQAAARISAVARHCSQRYNRSVKKGSAVSSVKGGECEPVLPHGRDRTHPSR